MKRIDRRRPKNTHGSMLIARRCICVLVLSVVMCAATPVFGGTTYWDRAAGDPGQWQDPDNWTDGVPGSVALIDNGGTAVIDRGAQRCEDRLTLGSQVGGTLIQNNGQLYVYGYFTVGGGGASRYEFHAGLSQAQNMRIGEGATSEVVHTGGIFRVTYGSLTLSTFSYGTYNFSGVNSRLRTDFFYLYSGDGPGGRFIQDGGIVSADTQLVIRSDPSHSSRPQYDLYAGELTVTGYVGVGYMGGEALMRQMGGTHSAEKLYVGELAAYEYSGGGLDVDETLNQHGVFDVRGVGDGISLGAFQQHATGSLISGVASNGITVMEVTGAAVLDGDWQVVDDGAPFGKYTVLTADGGISGTFSSFTMPGPEWSWGIQDGTTLWVENVPEPATLSMLVLGGLAVLKRRRRLETTTPQGEDA